mgnify:CR=1 FL=1
MYGSQSASPSGGVKGVNPVPEKRSDVMQIDHHGACRGSQSHRADSDPDDPQDDLSGKEGENAVEPSIGRLIPAQDDRRVDTRAENDQYPLEYGVHQKLGFSSSSSPGSDSSGSGSVSSSEPWISSSGLGTWSSFLSSRRS